MSNDTVGQTTLDKQNAELRKWLIESRLRLWMFCFPFTIPPKELFEDAAK